MRTIDKLKVAALFIIVVVMAHVLIRASQRTKPVNDIQNADALIASLRYENSGVLAEQLDEFKVGEVYQVRDSRGEPIPFRIAQIDAGWKRVVIIARKANPSTKSNPATGAIGYTVYNPPDMCCLGLDQLRQILKDHGDSRQ